MLNLIYIYEFWLFVNCNRFLSPIEAINKLEYLLLFSDFALYKTLQAPLQLMPDHVVIKIKIKFNVLLFRWCGGRNGFILFDYYNFN